METSELLYSLHEGFDTIRSAVPENGMLDTATGVDPLITQLFKGAIYFRISAIPPDGVTRTIYTHQVSVEPQNQDSFAWNHVSVDLSEFSGQEVELVFEKGVPKAETPTREVFDIHPEDLAFWRRPTVRHRALADRENVVLVSLDTLRADHLRYVGYSRETSPNLDKFASEGTFFTQCISQAPWTTPSHFSIFTSTYPSTHKMNQPIQITNRFVQTEVPTMAEIFRDHGYVTAAFTGSGAISAKLGFYRGFDFYNETPGGDRGAGHDVDRIVAKSVEWVRGNAGRSFFLFLHSYEPHDPYTDSFFKDQEDIPPSDQIAYRTAKYDGDIRRTDSYFGELVQAFTEANLLERTLFVVTSDHGEDLGGRNPQHARMQYGHAHNLYDELLRVPLIFRGPGVPSGQSIDYQVRSIDILPTVLQLVGLSPGADFEGSSLGDMLRGSGGCPAGC